MAKKKLIVGWMAKKYKGGRYVYEVYKIKRLAESIWGRSNIHKVKIEEII